MYGIKKEKLPIKVGYDEPVSTIEEGTDLREGFKTTGIDTEPKAIKSNNFVTGSTGWRFTSQGDLEANSGTFRGSLIAGDLHIPDQDTTANSFHTDTSGNTWWGATETNFNADNDNANAYVLNTGSAVFKSIKVGGTTTQYTLTDDGIFSYGDGSDGALTTSGDVSLTEDKYYTDLTVSDGDTFNPAGYRVFVSGTLTVGGGTSGILSRDGSNGSNGQNGQSGIVVTSGGSGGAALADGYLKGSVAGGSGGAAGGNNGGDNPVDGGNNDVLNSIGVDGGLGGDGADGPTGGAPYDGANGTQGTATASNVKLIANWHLSTLLDVSSSGSTVKFTVSASGGGGGGGGAHFDGVWRTGGGGGGAGSGGGLIAIYARKIIINSGGIIEAIGGNGGNGGNGVSNSGGGGGGAGGNGGEVVLVYNEFTNNGAITVTGGTGGTKGTGGSNGTDGTAGTVGSIRQFNISF